MEESFSMDFDDASSVWVLTGQAEDPDIERLRLALAEQQDRAVVVDLTSVTYLPSKMIGTLAVARQEAGAHGGSIYLRARPDTIAARLLSVMGLAEQS